MPHKKRHISLSSDDDDLPLKVIRQELIKTRNRECNLYKRSEEQCKFCEEVFYNKYNILVHNIRHIIVPLINHKVYTCLKCNRHFPSEAILFQHRESQHGIKIKIENNCILNDINSHNEDQNANHHHKPKQNNDEKPDPQISKLHDSSLNNSVENSVRHNNIEKQIDQDMIDLEENDIVNISNSSNDSNSKATLRKVNKTDIFNTMITKELVVTRDRVVTEFYEKSLENNIDNQPIILVEDTLSSLLSKKKTFIEHDESLAEIIKINVKQDNKDSIQKIEQEDECSNDYEIATIKKIQEDKYGIVAKLEPFHNEDSNSEMKTENIRNRLIFEDDEDYEDDLISLNHIENDVTNLPGADEYKEGNAGALYQGKMILGTRTTEAYKPSVHYDDLIEKKMYVCRHCGLISSNRFNSVRHELIHMKFSRRLPLLCPFCDRYIYGNYHTLKHHMTVKHPLNTKRNPHVANCSTCGLKYYNAYRHHRNYHLIYVCSVCRKRFSKECERAVHMDIHNMENINLSGKFEYVKLVKVCELCFLFFKSNQKQKYVYLKEYSEVGKKQKCDRCEKLFFNIKVVKLTTWRNLETEYKKKKISNSNEERLKHIQARLKKINKLSRFYFVVLFHFMGVVRLVVNDAPIHNSCSAIQSFKWQR